MSTLFENAAIVLEDRVIKCGYLGVIGDKISYIGEERPSAEYDIVKNMTGHLLMPGMYNLHTHSPMTLLRGMGSDLPLDRWLNEAIFPVEAKLLPNDFSAGSRLAMMEMLSSGVVSFTDMYDCPWITADEVIKAGMKANLSRPIVGFDPTEPYCESFRAKESEKFFKEYNKKADGRIIVDYAIHAEYTNYDELAMGYAADCKKMGAIMHLHLSETEKEHRECKMRHNGLTPTEWFLKMGVLDNPTVAAHCVWLEEGDMDILKEKNVTCVHNPSSNMKLGSGFMPIEKLLKRGINVALGTDGAASNNNLNMMEELHLASVIHNGFTHDPTILKPQELLKIAALNGACAQGRKNSGLLKEGCFADIAALNLDAPHLIPQNDIMALITYSAQASDVDMTMVNGKILYENGEFLTIDYEKTKADVIESVKHLI